MSTALATCGGMGLRATPVVSAFQLSSIRTASGPKPEKSMSSRSSITSLCFLESSVFTFERAGIHKCWMYFCFRKATHTLGVASSEGRCDSWSRFSQKRRARRFPISPTATTHSDFRTLAFTLWTSLMFDYLSVSLRTPTPSCWWSF